MRVLVTGANGQLGKDVIERLESDGVEYFGTDKNNMDLTVSEEVSNVIHKYKPDFVIHCAAYTAVDLAEEERELCYSVNVLGTRYVAEACNQIGAVMIYYSTDYVFSGEGSYPIEATEKPDPINYYGYTKYMGELEVEKILSKYFIIRISWVFGKHGKNFINTMLKLAKCKDEIAVITDQIGSPTYTYDLAQLTVKMLGHENYGVHHATNEGYCSWYDLACEVFQQADIEIKVKPILSKDYPMKANRPKNSRLYKEPHFEMRNWKLAVSHYLEELSR